MCIPNTTKILHKSKTDAVFSMYDYFNELLYHMYLLKWHAWHILDMGASTYVSAYLQYIQSLEPQLYKHVTCGFAFVFWNAEQALQEKTTNTKAELKAAQGHKWKNASASVIFHCITAQKKLKNIDTLFIYPDIWVK